MSRYLEHANMSVNDLEKAIHFLTTAFPEFRVRGGGDNANGTKWCHLGTDDFYIALSDRKHPFTGDREGTYVNHLGFAVDDAEGIRERMLAAGYKEGFKVEPHPYRKRVYFIDADGFEWEFVEYFTEDPAKRNDYSQ